MPIPGCHIIAGPIEHMPESGNAAIRRHFDFLVRDYGFTLTSDDADRVCYDTGLLSVAIERDKGTIDLGFRVKTDTAILRPYVSHRFSLAQVVRYYKTGPFPELRSFPPLPGISDEEHHVIYLATLTKQYCTDILRGDITPLERLSANPGARHQ